MFIPRKSLKVANTNQNEKRKSTKIMLPSLKQFQQNDVQLTQWPTMQYFLALCMIGLSIYFLYSSAGGKNSIPGFNNNLWWQYLISFIPLILGALVIIVCQSETVFISRKLNEIQITKKRCFCWPTMKINRRFDQINGVTVVKRGGQNAGQNLSQIHNRLYYIVISFNTCQTYEVLGCISSLSINQYFDELRVLFSQDQISQHRILVSNLAINQ